MYQYEWLLILEQYYYVYRGNEAAIFVGVL